MVTIPNKMGFRKIKLKSNLNSSHLFRMFKALSKQNINIQVISTSEIKISVLIDKRHIKKAVKALHKEFELEKWALDHLET